MCVEAVLGNGCAPPTRGGENHQHLLSLASWAAHGGRHTPVFRISDLVSAIGKQLLAAAGQIGCWRAK